MHHLDFDPFDLPKRILNRSVPPAVALFCGIEFYAHQAAGVLRPVSLECPDQEEAAVFSRLVEFLPRRAGAARLVARYRTLHVSNLMMVLRFNSAELLDVSGVISISVQP